MSQFAPFHLPHGSTFVCSANFDVVRCRGIQVLWAHFNQRKGALGAAQQNHQSVFRLRTIPLPCSPGLSVAAVWQQGIEIAKYIRLYLAILSYTLLDPRNPFIVVHASCAGPNAIACVVT